MSQNATSQPVTIAAMGEMERLVKSSERVRDLGEVFTPASTVQDMLDMLPDTVWEHYPSSTFLEPACGDGNFLVAILDRKLARLHRVLSGRRIGGIRRLELLRFHALEAVSSIYAVDISPDNVIGGTPGHEIGARSRMLLQVARWWSETNREDLAVDDPLLRSVQWIVDRNILVGNMLPGTTDGKPTGRDDLPLLFYAWRPDDGTVDIMQTTLGAVMQEAAAETAATLTLFGPPEPTRLGRFPAFTLHDVDSPAPSVPTTPTRNGKGDC